jgi:hypothetical protein
LAAIAGRGRSDGEMAILYPVAETAEAALHAARGFAARAREAEALAAREVHFVTEPVGPAFATQEAALAAFPEADGTGWRRLAPVTGEGAAPQAPLRPVYRDGRRWPDVEGVQSPLWRLSVSYWRIGGAEAVGPVLDPARKLRRNETGRELKGAALNALARQPLRAVKPQQPLDVGLFEVRPPEAPDTLIPDE